MNILLWVLQILLALHTAVGAVWKFSNPEQTVPSLKVIPHGIWLGMSVFELLCSMALLLPAFNRRLGFLVPVAAAAIAAEMLIFSGLHLGSGEVDNSPMVYWLVVAAVCVFILMAGLSSNHSINKNSVKVKSVAGEPRKALLDRIVLKTVSSNGRLRSGPKRLCVFGSCWTSIFYRASVLQQEQQVLWHHF